MAICVIVRISLIVYLRLGVANGLLLCLMMLLLRLMMLLLRLIMLLFAQNVLQFFSY